MYPPINKEQLPSAPPSYIESVNAQRYAADPQSMAPHLASQQPTQVIIVQAPGRKFLKDLNSAKCSYFITYN